MALFISLLLNLLLLVRKIEEDKQFYEESFFKQQQQDDSRFVLMTVQHMDNFYNHLGAASLYSCCLSSPYTQTCQLFLSREMRWLESRWWTFAAAVNFITPSARNAALSTWVLSVNVTLRDKLNHLPLRLFLRLVTAIDSHLCSIHSLLCKRRHFLLHVSLPFTRSPPSWQR